VQVLSNPELMEESIAQAQKMFAGGGLDGLGGEKMAEMMKMMQQPNALQDMLSNPELLKESMKQAQAMFGGAEGLAGLMDGGGLEGLAGAMGGAGAGGAGGGDSELKQRVRAQMAGMMRDRGDDGEEF
jgi:hypothetical protein